MCQTFYHRISTAEVGQTRIYDFISRSATYQLSLRKDESLIYIILTYRAFIPIKPVSYLKELIRKSRIWLVGSIPIQTTLGFAHRNDQSGGDI
eukprot:snap_masked-scaffold_1-processed-gene-17.17-mRNA-1 protein AED:1.00 eAED:1.00 QI:0/0/0/0/1/1/3/0/92